MKDLFTEIWESIRRNKLRTCLTGFAVAWGIFMIIVLLGAGNGLMNSFSQGSDTFATNTIMVGAGWTSVPYDGFKAGRRTVMEDRDIDLVKSEAFADYVDGVTATSGLSANMVYGNESCQAYVEGNFPSRMQIEKIELRYGRFINDLDIDQRRKVVVIPDDVVGKLIGEGRDVQSFLGERVKIGNLMYTVVGITKSTAMRGENIVYAPFTTIKTVAGKGKEIDDLTFSFHGLESLEENEKFEKDLKAAVNVSHRAAPDDERATWTWNRFTQNLQMQKANKIISTALWIIGLFTLLSGVVGVSNIMLITVKERTHEFGIRKAIGASPWNITKLIVAESVLITAFFGYIGMIAGLAACELLDNTLGHQTMDLMGESIPMMVNPSVGVDVAIEATLVLIVAGTLAGLFPARKAAKVRPIEALRAE